MQHESELGPRGNMAGLAFETVVLDRERRRDSGKGRYKIGPFYEFLSNTKQRGKGIWSGSGKQEGNRTAAEWEAGRKGCMLAHQHNGTLVPEGKREGKRNAETPDFPELHKDLELMRKGYLGKQRMTEISGTLLLLPQTSKKYISTLPAFHEVRFTASQVLVSLQFGALSRCHFKQLGLG